MPLQRNHRIHAAVVVLVAGDAHGTEDAAEAVGADPLHQAGVDAVQVLVDVGSDAHALGPPHVVPVGLEVGHPGLVDALGDGSEWRITALHAILGLLGEHIVAQLVLLAEQGLDLGNGQF